jgi:predicted XRE-type DNA-binding protein
VARGREKVESGSGDVFVDLGFKDAGERKRRVQLAMQVNALISQHGLTQGTVAEIFGIPRPQVSELKNYKLGRFSSEHLQRFLGLSS